MASVFKVSTPPPFAIAAALATDEARLALAACRQQVSKHGSLDHHAHNAFQSWKLNNARDEFIKAFLIVWDATMHKRPNRHDHPGKWQQSWSEVWNACLAMVRLEDVSNRRLPVHHTYKVL